MLRYDTQGHGRSGSRDQPTTIDDLANDLAGLLDALYIAKAHVVGLSLGGMTAQAFGVLHPERTAGLVLMATAAHLPPPDFWRQRAATVIDAGPEAVVDTIVPRWFTPGFQEREPAAVTRIRELFLESERHGYGRCCEAIADMDLRERITAITAPTLVDGGRRRSGRAVGHGRGDPQPHPRRRTGDDPRLRPPDLGRAAGRGSAAYRRLPRPPGARPPAQSFAEGLAIRRAVLGNAHVDRSLDNAGAFGMPWQDFITRTAWHDAWGDPTLERKTRSLLTLTMMIALHREEEFKLHVRPALANGVTIGELGALVRHAAVYAGIPAGNAAMRWLREVLGDELK